MALERTSLRLLKASVEKTYGLLREASADDPDSQMTFPRLSLQLNTLTKLVQKNLSAIGNSSSSAERRPLARRAEDSSSDAKALLPSEDAVDAAALSRLWTAFVERLSSAFPPDPSAAALASPSRVASLGELLHDHILAAQEAFHGALAAEAGLALQGQSGEGVENLRASKEGLGGGVETALLPALPALRPPELRSVVNCLNSFARLAHTGLVSLREFAAESVEAGAACTAATAQATAEDQRAEPEDSAATVAAEGQCLWEEDRRRLSSFVQSAGGRRMRSVEMTPGDRRSSGSIYAFFHRALLLLVRHSEHLDPQSLSNTVNAFTKARLQW